MQNPLFTFDEILSSKAISLYKMEGIKIREAVREDCRAIRSLIQELADFENMSDGPKISDRVLEEDGFNSEHPLFNCYVAETDGRLVGYAVYYYIYSTWTGKAMYLEDLYVTPDFRKKHIGSMLFDAVAKKAADSQCARLDFSVLNWNPAQDFYKSKGAVDLTDKEGWHVYRMEKVEFMFSRTLVNIQANIPSTMGRPPFQQAEVYHKAASEQLSEAQPIETKLTSSIETDESEFVPHEVDPLSAYCTSSSLSPRSKSSECKVYELPILYHDFENDMNTKQRLIESRWGRGTTLNIGQWEDCYAPLVKVKTMDDIETDNNEFNGILSDEIIGVCSSYLSKSPQNGLYVENKCELARMNLRDISALYYHRYLQYIDLTNNKISDLKPLGGIPCLIYLNAAHNKLRDVLKFTPPWYLTHVNLAHNQISKIDDLSEFWSIVRLDLSHNLIECIEGLHNLRHLRFLNLGYNLIECIENLEYLNVQELNLEYNCITDYKSAIPELGISTLPNLRTLILSHNKLSTLEFFEGAYGLRYIDLRYNKIADLLEVSHLKCLVHEVDFRGNPCTKWPSYREVLLFSMPSVMFVDGAGVTISEKVSASTLFAPPMELTTARSITKLMLLEHLNATNIDLHVSPIDDNIPPLIILSGPPGVKKSILARQIADRLPKRVRYCASHTTRDAGDDNSGKLSYHFVSREEFNEMTRRGEFLSTEELLGNSYGFHINEIKALVLEKKVGITHMDLHAALQMRGRYVNIKLILALTKSVDLHRQWIREKFEVFTCVKSGIQDLVAIKVGRHNRSNEQPEETLKNRHDFIDDILNEVIESLELPIYSINVRPQGTGATSTAIKKDSSSVLPKFKRTTNENEIERRHIFFRGTDKEPDSALLSKLTISADTSTEPPLLGLKVILDEHSNVFVESEKEKKERRKAKVLKHHNSIHLRMDDEEYNEDDEFVEDDNLFGEMVSSEELIDPKQHAVQTDSPKDLEELYVNLVIKSRELYLQQHINNPGCFSLVIFMDEFVLAFNKVIDLVYESYINHPFCKPMFSEEFQRLMRSTEPSKTRSFFEELRADLSTSKKQNLVNLRSYGLTSWSQALPSQPWQDAAEIAKGVKIKLGEKSPIQIAERIADRD